MQVFGLASRGLNLHVLADLIGEQMPVIGDEDDRTDPEVAQNTKAAPQLSQDFVHLETGLSDIVGLAQFVDLLRCDEHQLRALNALPDPFVRLRQ